MKRNVIEAVLGAVVLAGAAIFLIFAYSVATVKSTGGYAISAKFAKVGGLERGSDVRISGISVGTVTGQALDPKTFQAQVTLSINSNVALPTDTQAAIVGDGLLGGKYVNLLPGQAADKIKPGGELTKTKDYQSLEDLVGQIIFLATSSGETKGDAAKPDVTKMDAPK
jgi:phospholipid/cholesterol/gamma-HCH transport system substrate-binding protein